MTIPGFIGKPEDYTVSIGEQRAFLESLPEQDEIVLQIAQKYRLDHGQMMKLARKLATMSAKNDDHKRQLAVKLARANAAPDV